jgi:ABC-type multidrug transport system ATPase subunit
MHEHEARLEKLLAERRDAPRTTRKLRLPGSGLVGAGPVRSGEIVIRIEDVVVGYLPSKVVARAPFLAAMRGERIGIVGPNGAGKTTLLRTIAGELPLLDGAITFGNQVQLGYLAQLRAAAIPGATVLDALLESVPVTPGEARGYLARFLFRGDDVLKEVRLLSGGERSRLELALLGVMPSNVYLLDEPTNHLDVVAREAIETFLLETPATMLVVSHDRRFLETVCERLWVVDDGAVAPFDGGYRAWRSAIGDGWTVAAALEQEARRLRGGGVGPGGEGYGAARGGRPRAAAAATSAATVAGTPAATVAATPRAGRQAQGATGGSAGAPAGVSSPSARGTGASGAATAAPAPTNGRSAESRPKLARLSKDAYRRQREAVDAELTRLGLRKNHLELELSKPVVQSNFIELRRVSSELADVETALNAAEDAWLALEERAP